MTWIYAIPVWWMMLACMALAVALACGALAFTRSKLTKNDQITHNDVASTVMGGLETLMAVIVAFMVIGVWQQYNEAAQTVWTEAGTLSDMAHLSFSADPSFKNKLGHEILGYIHTVVDDEFPAMKTGHESVLAHEAGDRIEETVASFRPHSSNDAAIQSQELSLATRFLDARRMRIFANQSGIPNVLWAVMIFSGMVTIGFLFYFRVDRPRAQYIMVALLTALVTSIYVLVAELDYPFRGDISVSPYALVHISEILNHDYAAANPTHSRHAPPQSRSSPGK